MVHQSDSLKRTVEGIRGGLSLLASGVPELNPPLPEWAERTNALQSGTAKYSYSNKDHIIQSNLVHANMAGHYQLQKTIVTTFGTSQMLLSKHKKTS